jgi:hypothetical protein
LWEENNKSRKNYGSEKKCSQTSEHWEDYVEFKSFEKTERIKSVEMFNHEKFSSLKRAIYKITDKED